MSLITKKHKFHAQDEIVETFKKIESGVLKRSCDVRHHCERIIEVAEFVSRIKEAADPKTDEALTRFNSVSNVVLCCVVFWHGIIVCHIWISCDIFFVLQMVERVKAGDWQAMYDNKKEVLFVQLVRLVKNGQPCPSSPQIVDNGGSSGSPIESVDNTNSSQVLFEESDLDNNVAHDLRFSGSVAKQQEEKKPAFVLYTCSAFDLQNKIIRSDFHCSLVLTDPPWTFNSDGKLVVTGFSSLPCFECAHFFYTFIMHGAEISKSVTLISDLLLDNGVSVVCMPAHSIGM